MSFFLSEKPVTYKMAWSYRTRRTFTRPLGAPFVDVVVARPRYNRRRWGARRAAKKTVSAVVTLSQDAVWSLFNPSDEATSDARRWYPFAFTPSTVPGFAEYKATYSHFRILKAKLYISRNVLNMEGSTNNYLVVGSRPFAPSLSRGTRLRILMRMFRHRRRLILGRLDGRRSTTPAQCATWLQPLSTHTL